MLLSACGQLGGLSIISTYSTCMSFCSRLRVALSLTVQDFFSLAGLDDPFLGSLILSWVKPCSEREVALTSLSCVNLLAVLLWSLTTDKLGRRTILLPCQTLLVVILLVVGGLHFSGATATDPTLANAAAGTALVRNDYGNRRHTILMSLAGHLLSVDILVPSHCDVSICLLG